MEHEVFVPVPAGALRQVLRDPAGVARCVPGLQQDAEASARPVGGRLRIRIGSHTITYRGEATLTEHESIGGRFEPDGSFRGTYWKMTLESSPDGDEDASVTRSSENRQPSADEIAALRRLITDVLSRV